ncbi:hypothetical protein AVEN_185724-1 [Araneus ventricosus]|uniref:Reverse transcriptase domain-containing protein n=1 Tax=Araneus ventricosus TaxID=182803 RepID=A0A4Y2I0V7_ARAVE|nr:hypothetical protein AVEN_185724-1 [Araneus ventricosus]
MLFEAEGKVVALISLLFRHELDSASVDSSEKSELDCLFKWCTDNKLHLNIEKCSILSYTGKAQPLNQVYKINDLVLSRTDSVTDLGIIFDTTLDFSQHIDSMISKEYRRLGILKRKTREFSSEIALKVLYYAHVRSSLEYSSIIWNPNNRKKIKIIERIQNNFLGYLLYKKNGIYLQGMPSSCLRDMFNISSLCSRRDVSCVLFFYKVINGSIDCTDIQSAIHFAVPARSLRNQGSFPNVYSRFNYIGQLDVLRDERARPGECARAPAGRGVGGKALLPPVRHVALQRGPAQNDTQGTEEIISEAEQQGYEDDYRKIKNEVGDLLKVEDDNLNDKNLSTDKETDIAKQKELISVLPKAIEEHDIGLLEFDADTGKPVISDSLTL